MFLRSAGSFISKAETLNNIRYSGILNANVIAAAKNYNLPAVRKNDLNIPPPTDQNAILRMEIELRDKHQPVKKHGRNKAKQFEATDLSAQNVPSVDVSMEKVC